tara:strand:- start:1563 stop:1823 length:261 start_codon:yes stop_codon:yes gene_type:complete
MKENNKQSEDPLYASPNTSDVWKNHYTGETSGGMPYYSTNQFTKKDMNPYTYVHTLVRLISMKPLVRDTLSIVKWLAILKIVFYLH